VQDGLASARLAKWTKGFKCTGVENEDVVRLLHEAIARRPDLNLECVAVINDNVGVLMTGAHTDPNCRIGLILGTGTNCCYLEHLEKVELWNGDLDEPKQMIINTEWGAFGDDGVIDFIRNDYDRQVDQSSLNPGHQLFEKMISGMYMGEIVRLVLCDLTLRGLLFHGQGSEELFEPQRFYTKYISEIESDDPAGEYSNTKLVLQELDIHDVTRDDCRYVQHVCWQVSQRAAFLAATAVAVVIDRVSLPEVTVAVDGSLYRFHPHFKDIMNTKISQLVKPQQKFKLILANDGSGQGAALVAAIAVKSSPLKYLSTIIQR
jgi:hexokinase